MTPPPVPRAIRRPLIILGASSVAEVAYEYFTHDSPHDVVAFAVDREYVRTERLFGVPVLPLDEIEQQCPPADHAFFAATNYTDGSSLRRRFYDTMMARGYEAASYVSSRAFVW